MRTVRQLFYLVLLFPAFHVFMVTSDTLSGEKPPFYEDPLYPTP